MIEPSYVPWLIREHATKNPFVIFSKVKYITADDTHRISHNIVITTVGLIRIP